MNKIKLLVRQLDGTTFVEQAPEFQLVHGWTQATLPAAAGVLPAGLWGKVPGGDPYLLHVSVLTTGPLAVGDFFELQSGSPSQPRRQYQPTPGNTVLVLVRPTDRLRFVVAGQLEVAVELLVESIGGVNELGSRLFAWAQATQAGEVHKATSGVVVAPLQIPAWTGLLHLIHQSPNPDVVTLPPRGLVPLDATLTFTKHGIGTPVLTAGAGDTLSGGLPNIPVTRTVFVMNNGDEWAFVGN
ncbi:MAG: hypothetical protein H0T76_19000 [Nannocystis sp.]|nr:hypothetical protein [Nannocystis sp.]MBA3548577.1 hypothetical protein [Nannocystis sp.]